MNFMNQPAYNFLYKHTTLNIKPHDLQLCLAARQKYENISLSEITLVSVCKLTEITLIFAEILIHLAEMSFSAVGLEIFNSDLV